MQTVPFQRFGPVALESIRDWQKLLQDSAGNGPQVQLGQVNDFFNCRVRFREDQDI